jgi:hypothetical protein
MAPNQVTYQSLLSRHSNNEIHVGKFGAVLIYHKKQNSFVYEPNKCLKCTLFLNLMKTKLKKNNEIKCFFRPTYFFVGL